MIAACDDSVCACGSACGRDTSSGCNHHCAGCMTCSRRSATRKVCGRDDSYKKGHFHCDATCVGHGHIVRFVGRAETIVSSGTTIAGVEFGSASVPVASWGITLAGGGAVAPYFPCVITAMITRSTAALEALALKAVLA